MKKIFFLLLLVLYASVLFAQPKSKRQEGNKIIEVYDVVGVRGKLVDRAGNHIISEKKGRIVSYDEYNGAIVFQATDNKIYRYENYEYEYFQYDKEFVKKIRVLKPRKENKFGLSVGASPFSLFVPFDIKNNTNDYFAENSGDMGAMGIGLDVVAGRYINKNHFVGLAGQYIFLSFIDAFNIGAKYQYLYSPNKNVSFYFPVAMKYNKMNCDFKFSVLDSVAYIGENQFEQKYYKDVTGYFDFNSAELNIGQGISFAMKNEKSISVEVMFMKYFILSNKISGFEKKPDIDFNINGVEVSVLVNF